MVPKGSIANDVKSPMGPCRDGALCDPMGSTSISRDDKSLMGPCRETEPFVLPWVPPQAAAMKSPRWGLAVMEPFCAPMNSEFA